METKNARMKRQISRSWSLLLVSNRFQIKLRNDVRMILAHTQIRTSPSYKIHRDGTMLLNSTLIFPAKFKLCKFQKTPRWQSPIDKRHRYWTGYAIFRSLGVAYWRVIHLIQEGILNASIIFLIIYIPTGFDRCTHFTLIYKGYYFSSCLRGNRIHASRHSIPNRIHETI